MLLLLSIIFNPSSAFADDFTANVIVKPSLRITLPTTVLAENLDPANTPFGEKSLTVTVATNNENGYKLYLNSNNTTRLVNTVDNTKYIDTLTSSATGTEEAFPVNSWGYRISVGDTGDSSITSTTNYYPFVSGKVISSSPIATNGVSSTLDFASKIDYTKPAGQYNIALNFKALPIVTQTYMQNMDPNVCTTDPTIVIDSRDEHPYTIQRLADGKCWMLDNLDLDLTSRTIVDGLTASNTNIHDDYALTSLKGGYRNGADCSLPGMDCNKYATAGLEYHNWTGSGMIPESPDHSYSQPLANRSGKCDPSKNTVTGSNWPCVGVWQGSSYTNNTIIDRAGSDNKIYNYGLGGYKIGTYYNYCAVTAGTYCYSGASSGDTTSDICPAGWHLPSADGGNNGDYLRLCSAIKGGEGCSIGSWNDMDILATTSLQRQFSTSLSGGYDSGTVYLQGVYGYFWSSTYLDSTYMRVLLVSSSGVRPTTGGARDFGSSARCVSP